MRRDIRATGVNRTRRSRIRTFIKKTEAEIASGDQKKAQAALRLADKEGQRGVTKGVFHKNTIARRMSRLSKRIQAMGKKPA